MKILKDKQSNLKKKIIINKNYRKLCFNHTNMNKSEKIFFLILKLK